MTKPITIAPYPAQEFIEWVDGKNENHLLTGQHICIRLAEQLRQALGVEFKEKVGANEMDAVFEEVLNDYRRMEVSFSDITRIPIGKIEQYIESYRRRYYSGGANH